ncbi:hypothetical protein AVEN_143765-1 [Araneus ventricosus]|uniref:Uncharacterized protein n=1 Tax=Araneus ventricosus TaxID=182803 RepID=A0A4Y2AP50_ARAVE|nr:hypothetical protein AVEN_143765-1 [Araneus ventricosus]
MNLNTTPDCFQNLPAYNEYCHTIQFYNPLVGHSRLIFATQVRQFRATTDRQCEKLAWCGAKGWISNLSEYPSRHLDCRIIKPRELGSCGGGRGLVCVVHRENWRRWVQGSE